MLILDFSEKNTLPSVNSKYEQDVIDFIEVWKNEDIKEIKMKTSGSTGKPKEILHSKNAMLSSAMKTNAFFGIDSTFHCFLGLPIDFVAGKMMLVRCMVAGAKITIVEPSASPLSSIDQTFDFAPFTPHQIQSSWDDLYKVKTILIGGAAVSNELKTELKSIYNTQFYESYGMTETISHVALKKLPEDSYFTALPGVTFKVNNEDCLIIDAPDILLEPIETNDVVELLNDHQFIWKGRADFVINSGGIKIHPEEVEQIIKPHLLGPFYVHKMKDRVFGEVPILVIEREQKISLDKLNEYLPKKYKLKMIVLVNIINFTSRNKVIRKDIKG